MTYFGFLLRFLLIPILIFLVLRYLDDRNKKELYGFQNGRAVWIAILVHILLAVIYTTPWDNYLVASGVWYYNPALVNGLVLGHVPIEEYIFFILETVLSGLWWWFLAARSSPPLKDFRPNRSLIYPTAAAVIFLWIVSTFLFFGEIVSFTYLSIILFWALPAILPQLLFGADILWHHRRLVFWAILTPGMYLSLVDIFALSDTTWSISKEQTTGLLFFGILPIEEVVFFFITNILIVFGMTLLLATESKPRLEQIRSWLRRSRGRGSTSGT
jgi:lycopene cyclase domain-containing protein